MSFCDMSKSPLCCCHFSRIFWPSSFRHGREVANFWPLVTMSRIFGMDSACQYPSKSQFDGRMCSRGTELLPLAYYEVEYVGFKKHVHTAWFTEVWVCQLRFQHFYFWTNVTCCVGILDIIFDIVYSSMWLGYYYGRKFCFILSTPIEKFAMQQTLKDEY